MRKATGNHLVKTRSPVSGFCYAWNRACDAVLKGGFWSHKNWQRSSASSAMCLRPATHNFLRVVFIMMLAWWYFPFPEVLSCRLTIAKPSSSFKAIEKSLYSILHHDLFWSLVLRLESHHVVVLSATDLCLSSFSYHYVYPAILWSFQHCPSSISFFDHGQPYSSSPQRSLWEDTSWRTWTLLDKQQASRCPNCYL